tara:strand:- start:76 stop:4137 length:4062 start_codon:yes stop_codon:yes gene_type:complete
MAMPTIKLEYWDGDSWEQALTHSAKNAVLITSISKQLNNAAYAEVLLSNKSKNYTSTSTSGDTASTGNLTNVFTSLMDCRLIDEETGAILFRGRIYSVQNQFNLQHGSVIKLLLRDILQELVEFPLEDVPTSLKAIDLTHANTDRRQEVFTTVVSTLSSNIDITHTSGNYAKIDESLVAFDSSETKTAKNGKLDISKEGKGKVLRFLHNTIAMTDPHASSNAEHLGFDYYVDPGIVSFTAGNVDAATPAKAHLNYFKRGSRPGLADQAAGTYSSYATYGFTAEYPSSNWTGQTDFIKAMLPDCDFDADVKEVYTSVAVHYTETKKDVDNNDENASESARTVVGHFELMTGTVTGSFTTVGRRLEFDTQYPPDSGSDGNGVNQSDNTENPFLLYAQNPSGGTTTNPCATIHAVLGSNTFLLSNVYNVSTAVQITNETAVTFDAFPTDSSNIKLFTTSNTAGSETPSNYITINPSTGRLSQKLKMNRPYRLQTTSQSPETIKKEIIGILDRTSEGTLTKARFNVMKYPMTKLVASSDDTSAGGNTNTIVFGNGTFTLADGTTPTAASGNGYRKDVAYFGAKVGMPVAQLDSTGKTVDRYSYISAISSNSITYGLEIDGTDTSDTTAINLSSDTAIFVPVEPGHTIGVKNKLWDKDFSILVQKIEYTVQGGIVNCSIEGMGLDTNGTGIPASISTVFEPDIDEPINIPHSQQNWYFTDASLSSTAYNKLTLAANSGSPSVVHLRISPSGKVFEVTPGEYTITATDTNGTGANTNAEYMLFIRPMADQDRSGTGFVSSAKAIQVVLRANYKAELDDIPLGIAKADHDTTNGRASFTPINIHYQDASATQFDLSKIANNRLSAALLKPSAQAFTTSVEFKRYPDTSSSAYNRFSWTSGSISFAEDGSNTITIDAGNSDASYGSSGNYLSEDTTYYAYLTIPTSGNGTISVTDDYRTPFDKDKVLLATVVVGSDPSATGYVPTILPYNGKVPTLSAVSIAANAITADAIEAGTITATELASDFVITNTFKTSLTVNDGSGTDQDGIIITSAGIKGYSSGGDEEFKIMADTGKATFAGITMGSNGISFANDGATDSQLVWSNTSSGTATHFYKANNADTFSFTTSHASAQSYIIDNFNVTINDTLSVVGQTDVTTIVAATAVKAANGSQAAPSYTFTNDTDTGFFSGGSNSHSVKVGGGNETLFVFDDNVHTTYKDIWPNATGANLDLGGSAFRYDRLYAQNDTDVSSDIRLKENVTPITNALDLITALTPIQYNKIGNNQIDLGLSAQEVKEVFLSKGYTSNINVYSELEHYVDAEGNYTETVTDTKDASWGLTYSQLIAPLIAAIKELKAEVDALKNG